MQFIPRVLFLALAPSVLLLGACRSTPEPNPLPFLTDQEVAEGWQLLFDGESIDHWRVYQKAGVSRGWRVVDATLARTGTAGDLITLEQYGSFILDLEWKISPGGNSGILFHVAEDHDDVWETGPEMQILDNAVLGDGLSAKQSAGANYAMHAPVGDFSRPVGEWNHARIEVRGPKVVHYLNGVKLLEYSLWSPEWKELVAGCKFSAMPDYGMRRRGHIALQDHGDPVWFRNIKILSLD